MNGRTVQRRVGLSYQTLLFSFVLLAQFLLSTRHFSPESSRQMCPLSNKQCSYLSKQTYTLFPSKFMEFLWHPGRLDPFPEVCFVCLLLGDMDLFLTCHTDGRHFKGCITEVTSETLGCSWSVVLFIKLNDKFDSFDTTCSIKNRQYIWDVVYDDFKWTKCISCDYENYFFIKTAKKDKIPF